MIFRIVTGKNDITRGSVMKSALKKGYCQRDKTLVGQISLYFSDSSSWLWIFLWYQGDYA